MKVRDYELDQYCVVNNAVYANYCQEARAEMFSRCGINTQNIAKSGNAIATVEMNVKYLAPLRVSLLYLLLPWTAEVAPCIVFEASSHNSNLQEATSKLYPVHLRRLARSLSCPASSPAFPA